MMENFHFPKPESVCDREGSEQQPISEEELWNVLQEAWEAVSEESLQK